ncbi:hypothetical protein EVJ58_g5860 [Rhodofomes roseus]|uniref:Uncharacterized protein n=1 Tax=Rhodofomes roseus TaxID=34475 RepID=A0A4Y9YBQ3_9APHY|nr:hypothetical protein EVJ58_g5860 [Rhodofomes roseus]
MNNSPALARHGLCVLHLPPRAHPRPDGVQHPRASLSKSRTPFHPPPVLPPRTAPSFLAAMSQIYHEGASAPPHSASGSANNIFTRVPVVKFYRGFSVTLVGIVPYAGTSFLTWGFLQAYFAPPARPGEPGRAAAAEPRSRT